MRVAGRDLLIGATEHTVALLAQFDAGDEAAGLGTVPPAADAAPPHTPPAASEADAGDPARAKLDAFKRRLAEAMARPQPEPPEADAAAQVEFSVPTRDPAWVRHREVA